MRTSYNILLTPLLLGLSLMAVGQSPAVTGRQQGVDSVVQVQPDFPGGMVKMYKFIHKQMHYPRQAKKDGVQGKVYVEFVVEADGSVDEVTVRRGVCPELDAEALRVIKAMPRWSPGMINGKAVRCHFTIPMIFRM